MLLHSRSTSSLRSFWENASNVQTSTDLGASDDSDDSNSDDDEVPLMISSNDSELGNSMKQANVRKTALSVPQSRRNSGQYTTVPPATFPPKEPGITAPAVAVSAFMLAWRDHLVAQLHQFNESAQSVMPNLGNMNGPLATLQDYQANGMVRRVSSLWPQRPTSRQQGGNREGWWEALTGASSPTPSSPPAYGDLYPDKEESSANWSDKKSSTIEAAADAAADLHFEQREGKASSSNSLFRTLGNPPIERIELSRDRKLFFFWVRVPRTWRWLSVFY